MADASSAFELYDRGLCLEAARAIDSSANASRDLLVLRALLESLIGNPALAQSAAHNLLRQQLNLRDRSVCWEVIGRVALSTGQINEGLRAMSKASEACSAAHDDCLESRLLASYTELMLHCVGLEPAALEMTKLRQAATRAGD